MFLYRDAGISAVAFHPNRRAAVSSSYGGDFKVILVAGILVLSSLFSQIVYSVIFLMCQVWICNDELQQKDLQSSGWSCHAVGSYKYDFALFSFAVVVGILSLSENGFSTLGNDTGTKFLYKLMWHSIIG